MTETASIILVRHPLALAALARSGIAAQDVLDNPAWREGSALSYGDIGRGVPRIVCSNASVLVYHPATEDGIETVFSIVPNADGGQEHDLELRGFFPPDILLAALAGRHLHDVVDLEGARDLVVDHASMMPKGLLLRLRPPAPEHAS